MNRSDRTGSTSGPSLRNVVMAVAIAAILCSCMFGGDDEEKAAEESTSPVLSTIIAKTKEAGGRFEPGQNNPSGSNIPSAPGSTVPTPTAVPPVDQNVARKLLWVHMSQCITLDESDIEAVDLQGDWYVRSTSESEHKLGLWKVANTGDAVEPYDAMAKQWSVVVSSQCDPNLKRDLATPLPRIRDAEAAATGLWSQLVTCFPDLNVSNLKAVEAPVKGKWIITTSDVQLPQMDRAVNFGVWALDGATGRLESKDPFADKWANYIIYRCDPAKLEEIKALFPTPTPGLPVSTGMEAQNVLWVYLAPCFPDRVAAASPPVLDPASGKWTITQPQGGNTNVPPGGPTETPGDTAVWSVDSSGRVTAQNDAAKINSEKIDRGC